MTATTVQTKRYIPKQGAQIKSLLSPAKGKYDFKEVNLKDERVWNLISRGMTKGLFQIESQLGVEWCKKVKPQNILELSDVISLVRPGPLESKMSDSYVKRKFGKEPITYVHPALEPILKNTWGTLVYQEQAIKIAEKLAGFNPVEADTLRKGIGKKDTETLSKCKTMFIEKAVAFGLINKEEAEEIFGWIQKSVRYSFNQCLSPETIVETKDGFKKLGDITVNDYVKAPVNNRDKYIKVLNVFDQGEQYVCEVRLSSGKQITCTLEHKFLCEDKIIRRLWEIIAENHKMMCKESDKMHAESIKAITPIGKQKTLDIEVDSKEHLFYGNGIATSNSHAVSYALTSYLCAYQKTHFPTEFYCSWLTFSSDKPDPKQEVYELVMDAKLNNIEILPPDITIANTEFKIVQDRKIVFGIKHIRGIGDKAAQSILKNKHAFSSWRNTLCNTEIIRRSIVESLVKSGACDCFKLDRCVMIKELYALFGASNSDTAALKSLTDKELAYVLNLVKTTDMTIMDILQSAINNKACVTKRIPALQSKIEYLSKPMKDTAKQKSIFEKIYLGLNLSCSAVDDVNIIESTAKGCRDVLLEPPGSKGIVYAVCDEIRKRKTGEKSKTPGREFAYIVVSDNTGALQNLTIWPEQFDEIKDELYETSILRIGYQKDSWMGRDQYIAKTISLVE